MARAIVLHLLEEQIKNLREELESKIGNNIDNLILPDVLALNQKIDELMVQYIKLKL